MRQSRDVARSPGTYLGNVLSIVKFYLLLLIFDDFNKSTKVGSKSNVYSQLFGEAKTKNNKLFEMFCAIGFFFEPSGNWQKSPVEYWFIKTGTQVFIQKMMAWLKLNEIKSVIKNGEF